MKTVQSSMDGTSAEVIAGLLNVLFPDAVTVLDATYGNGNFWPKNLRVRQVGRESPERGCELPLTTTLGSKR